MKNKRSSTAKMQIACAIIFITFTYVYLAFYQADVLAVAQHVFSGGLTNYSYTLAPLLITLVLYLLQVGVYAVTRVKRRFHGLTYFPSFLILTMITDIPVDIDRYHSLGAWWIILPLCLILWGGLIWIVRQLEPIETEPHSNGWFSRYMWVNLLQMLVMILLVNFVASNDRLFHERMRMEHLMKEKQYEKALEVGEKSLKTDSSLTMLRIARQLEPIETEPHSNGWFSRYMWVNLLQMLVMILLVNFVASNDRLFHERMRMEHLMKEKQYEKALEVGEKSLKTDSSLTMLRIACLNETGELGSRLFTYPLVGGSKAMMPDSVTVKAMMWKAPKWMQKPSAWMVKHHLKYRLPVDYQLCALLLDKQLDKFVAEVQKHYKVTSGKLPVHYKEALVLYTHRRSNPSIVYHDNVMDTDFEDFQQMDHKYANETEKQNALRDTYGNTYWYYYEYGNK